MEASRRMPALGEPFEAVIPESKFNPVTVTVQDLTSNLFTQKQAEDMVWSLKYQALYHYNRSPWVEHGYCAPIQDVILIGKALIPAPGPDHIHVELLDTSDQPGALGYHDDQEHKSTAVSSRGLAENGETPIAKVFCKTSEEYGVAPSEVASHEIMEAAVDPFVVREEDIRTYLNPDDGYIYIAEVGDPVQDRGYDVGAPEGRPCKVTEAVMADFAYPAWWAQEQRRIAVCFCDDAEAWTGASLPHPSLLRKWELAPGGYMSRREPNGSWEQIYGSDKKKAEANAHGYEGSGDAT